MSLELVGEATGKPNPCGFYSFNFSVFWPGICSRLAILVLAVHAFGG